MTVTTKELYTVLKRILEEDHKGILYRPNWSSIPRRNLDKSKLGEAKNGKRGQSLEIGVHGAILLQQVRFRWLGHGEKPFYKFFAPSPNSRFYRLGDSWLEELGFESPHIVSQAFSKIGRKVNRYEVETWRKITRDEGYFVVWFQAQDRLTWFYFDEGYFLYQLASHYARLDNGVSLSQYLINQNRDTAHRDPDPNNSKQTVSNNSNQRIKKLQTDITENTTESPKDNMSNPLETDDYLTHVIASLGNLNESLSIPDDWEKFWGARDESLKIFRQKMGFAAGDNKGAYLEFTGEHVTKDEDLKTLETSFDSAILNWSGRGRVPLARVIEVYLHGQGDYDKFAAWKWGETNGNRDKPPPDFRSEDEKQALREAIAALDN